MSQRVLTRLTQDGVKPICASANCSKPLKKGDRVISKMGHGSKRKVFHVECYRESFVDV